MKNNRNSKYGLNLDNTIFVVDSPVTAFMISILADGRPVNLLLEKKKGLETDHASDLLLNFVNSCISIKHMKIVELPHRFYIGGKDLVKIWNIRKETKKLYDEYDEDAVYVGASTSTFMRSFRRKHENIIYLHHGLTDLIRKEDENKYKKGLRSRLRSFIVGKIIGLPYSTWCNYWPEKAFSLCRLNNENERWLNLYDFESKQIENTFKTFSRFADKKNNVLFFPVIEGHVKGGVNSDVTSFDQFNYDFLIKHIDPENDRIFIKYHPWLYRANDTTRIDLTEMLNKNGIEAYDIASMIPEEIGGVLLPTEVICRFFDFKKMISMDTSTMWYLSGNKNIIKIIDIRNAPDDYRDIMVHCIEQLKVKSDTDDIQFFI